jgi:hypothetical protein
MTTHTDEPFIFTRRFNGAWHVVVRNDGLEHPHREGFAERGEAFVLADEVEAGLASGLDLNLALWESEALS